MIEWWNYNIKRKKERKGNEENNKNVTKLKYVRTHTHIRMRIANDIETKRWSASSSKLFLIITNETVKHTNIAL